jgi:hypothetical protein
MDPVVALACQIRDAEAQLCAAVKLNQVVYTPLRAEAIVTLLRDIRNLYEALFTSAPTSLPGAGEQVRFAADRLPYDHARHAIGLHNIAGRFTQGHCTSADLAWLRTLARSVRRVECGAGRSVAAMLLQSAADAIARPSVVHRTARPARPRAASLPRLDVETLQADEGAGARLSAG